MDFENSNLFLILLRGSRNMGLIKREQQDGMLITFILLQNSVCLLFKKLIPQKNNFFCNLDKKLIKVFEQVIEFYANQVSLKSATEHSHSLCLHQNTFFIFPNR